MRRTLNFTGRKLIPQDDFQVQTIDNGGQDFDLDLDLDGLGLPDSAQIYVEAYYRTDLMRFGWGTVGAVNPPSEKTLDEFADVEAVRFRIKVVDSESDLGRILARREQIRPGSELEDGEDSDEDSGTAGESLLPVAFVDLGDEIWRLNVDPAPTLELNNRDERVEREFRHNPQFRSLVLPDAFRQILRQILIIDPVPLEDIQAGEGWESKWLKFAEKQHGDPPPEGSEEDIQERTRWIDGAVARFCEEHGFLASFVDSV